ncbi:IclR family transcriptional regulator [Corynebacterium sp. HMSC074E01]|uniref:IclR family transcriptional regulator n=1 Tax=Corynebacterium sp. HMSC074E01 TaxID=1715017 RepID=UPI0008A346C7|nr:IclR family transcriptional regulator [Corynebacterium sp. HMSC074E01]OFN75748.1 IclR family transcriptional regulator [Corynebacterium sp. HMSC074E01]
MSTSRVPAARNALEILRLLSTIDVPISAARIRSELDLPRSSTYHLLKEMVDAGFVVHLPENQTYGLGLAAYSMAAAYATQQPLVKATQGHLERIASTVGGSGHLSRLAGSEILYLNEVRAPGALSLVTEKGVRLQAQRTASGRAMLALLPEAEWRAAYFPGSLGFGEYKDILRQVRERGWAEEIEVVARGQASVGVAVVDHVGRPAAALAVTFPVGTVDAEGVAEKLHAAAQQVAARMYGRR